MEHPKPTDSTVYRLYGSSQHCAFPGCTEPHIEVDENTGVKICNAEVCHINARRENGPRWDASQNSEENRSDGNLVLLCRKHHSVVDDRRNEEYYTPDLLKAWKAEQEEQKEHPLAADDLEAIAQTNVIIAAESVNLGGEGGAPPGSGGGGAPSQGVDSVGGRCGDGGDVHIDAFSVDPGEYRVVVGRGARLPGEIGGASYLEKVAPDGRSEQVAPKVGGGVSGDSYLPEEVPEIDAASIQRAARVCCLTVVEGAAIEKGAHRVGRFALSRHDVNELPTEVVFSVLTVVTKRPDEMTGYFVSLFFDG